MCTHLVYGYAGIDPLNNKLTSLNPTLDLDQGKGNYRIITTLKRDNPNLKVLLSVGGDSDPNRDLYLSLLENNDAQTAFINSAYTILKTYNCDGLDLAWQFPSNKPKRIRSAVGKNKCLSALVQSQQIIINTFHCRWLLVRIEEGCWCRRQTSRRKRWDPSRGICSFRTRIEKCFPTRQLHFVPNPQSKCECQLWVL